MTNANKRKLNEWKKQIQNEENIKSFLLFVGMLILAIGFWYFIGRGVIKWIYPF